MKSRCGLLFWTLYFIISELNYVTNAQKSNFDKMMVKPLEIKKPSNVPQLGTNSAVALFQVDPLKNRTASTVKSNQIARDASEEYNSNEKLINKVAKSRKEKTDEKLSDKDLLDNIAEMILKRSKNKDTASLDAKYLNVAKDIHSAHRHPNIDFDYGNDHLHVENSESKLYAMKLPVKIIETPEDGILGKLHFRFVPISKHQRVPVRDIHRHIH